MLHSASVASPSDTGSAGLALRSRFGLLLAVAAAVGALGDLRVAISNACLLAGLALGLAAPLWQAWRSGSRWARVACATAALAWPALGLLGPEVQLLWMALVLALLAGANGRSQPGSGSARAEYTAWALAVGALAVFVALHARWAPLHEFERAVTRGVTEVATGLLTGRAYPIGPTMLGLQLLAFVVLLQAARVALAPAGHRSIPQRVLVALMPWLAAPLLFAVAAWWAGLDPHGVPASEHTFDTDTQLRRHTSLGQFLFPANVRLLVLALAVLGEWLWSRPASVVPGRASRMPVWRVAGTTALVLGGYWLVAPHWLSRELPRSDAPLRIAFHDAGSTYFRAPVDDQWSLTVSFSALPTLLEALGHRVETAPFDARRLDETDVVVFVNLHERLPESDRAALRSWLEAGGSVLCLGDHTGDEQIRLPFNHLLEGTGIAFRFDSARALGSMADADVWLDPHLYPDRSPPASVTDPAAMGIGASLEVRAPARPVLVAGNAFSDPGDRDAADQGMVGNLQYDFGEELGDLVLVASAPVGAGQVLVFGDTSPFQSMALPTSGSFVARVFAVLARADRPAVGTRQLTLLLLVAACWWLARSAPPAWWGVLAAAATVVHCHADAGAKDGWDPFRNELGARAAQVAWIDGAHHSSLDPFGEYGLDGVGANLSRRGLIPRMWYRGWEELPESGLLVSLDARRPISVAEVDALEDFLQRGGNALVTLSHDAREAHDHLLQRFGVELPFEPLGRCRAATNLPEAPEVEFVAAWPLVVSVPHEVLVSAWQHTVVARIQRGPGSLVLCGDGRFLRANNLEAVGGFVHRRNMSFVREVLRSLGSPQ